MKTLDRDVFGAVVVSTDGLYRYRLSRQWGGAKFMCWVMLNPSTADEKVDDPTIRRCMSFARREGWGGIEVINLFALRSTKPEHLLDHPDPEGRDNVQTWQGTLDDPNIGCVVAAWGASGTKLKGLRSQALWQSSMTGWLCLGRTKDGYPRHPLFVSGETELEMFR